jgi:hypothetical protein
MRDAAPQAMHAAHWETNRRRVRPWARSTRQVGKGWMEVFAFIALYLDVTRARGNQGMTGENDGTR